MGLAPLTQMFCDKRRGLGFTLVELLTVLAVVGVLLALAAGAWSGVRRQQQKAACAQNMRQLGVALLLHVNDHQGRFPLTMHGATDVKQSWVHTLAPYLENVDEVRICPADPKADERLELGQSSYVLNEFVFVPARDPFGRPVGRDYSLMANLPAPSQVQLAYVISDRQSLSNYNDHTHSRGWSSWARVVADIQPNRFTDGESAADGLGGSANYLYADGHVESIDAVDLRARVLAGENPANPDPAQ